MMTTSTHLLPETDALLQGRRGEFYFRDSAHITFAGLCCIKTFSLNTICPVLSGFWREGFSTHKPPVEHWIVWLLLFSNNSLCLLTGIGFICFLGSSFYLFSFSCFIYCFVVTFIFFSLIVLSSLKKYWLKATVLHPCGMQCGGRWVIWYACGQVGKWRICKFFDTFGCICPRLRENWPLLGQAGVECSIIEKRNKCNHVKFYFNSPLWNP